ncbi:MAG: recombinase family protein [Paracoccaceae bacterium]|uniref:recombinase family protein n=2 Tax=Alphaproteobacteria TaxID=28211 RepID=UPI003277672B
MTNAVIYARYSTDMQSDASIEDQIRMCKERAEKDGYTVINCYSDHAISGASMMRPGIQMMMQDAAAGKFSMVYAEALDRMSRDQEDIAAIFKRMSFSDVAITTLSEGEISQLHIGLKGTMNALFLKDLADKTRRGLRGRVEQGKSGGGKCYGYDIIPGDEKGGRTINKAEAAIVVRICREYATGKSPKAIAQQLNKEGIAGPTGNGWGPSTINGNRNRGTGILNNELYIGKLVWNRLRYLKDPTTGKRVSKLNDEKDWIIQDVPGLRILDEELWRKVKDRQGAINKQDKPLWAKQRPKNLFSGLVKCGCCGGGFSMISQTHLGCSNARNKGTCDNRKAIKREKLEEDVLKALRTHLMDPKLSEMFCEEYTRHMNELRRNHNAALAGYQNEHKQVKKRLDQMVDAIADGAPVAPIKDKMHELENRRVALESMLTDIVVAPPMIHPSMAERYHSQVQTFIQALNAEETRSEAAEVIRSLIEKIVLTPDESENRLVADLHGDLAGILAISADKKSLSEVDETELARHKALLGLDKPEESDAGENQQDKLVAGAGFEPATFRL